MTKEKDRFYFKGTFYDSYEEYLQSNLDFYGSKISKESTDYLIEEFKVNLRVNLDVYGKNLTNAELSFLLNEAWMKLITQVQEKFIKEGYLL